METPGTARAALSEDIETLEMKDNLWVEKSVAKDEDLCMKTEDFGVKRDFGGLKEEHFTKEKSAEESFNGTYEEKNVDVEEKHGDDEVLHEAIEETDKIVKDIEIEQSGVQESGEFESETHNVSQTVLEDQSHEKAVESSNPFGVADQPHQTETDEFEFHQEANVNASDNIHFNENSLNNVSANEVDVKVENLERETDAQTFNIGGMSTMDFVNKYATPSNDEIHGIQKDEEEVSHKSVADGKQDFGNDDSIKEEDEEEEIQIGMKVSDLNETDIMSRSFYGDYDNQEPARSPSPEEMIDHYERQLRENEAREQIPEEHPDQITPTGDATTLEAKLAQEDSHATHVEDKPQEPQDDNQVSEQIEEKETTSNLFEISHEETFSQEKIHETFDDLTFETKTETSEPKSLAATLETRDDISSQEIKEQEVEPQQETKVEETISIPDVVPTQGDESQTTPTVDLTQDIVEEVKLSVSDDNKVASSQEENNLDVTEGTKDTSAADIASTVAIAGALALGAAATAAVVKKASTTAKKPTTSITKKPEVKPTASKTAAKPLAAKPSVMKTSLKPGTSVAAKPAAKPASKPLAAKPATSKLSTTSSTAPKPLAPKKTTLTKTSTSTVTAPKPMAAKPTAPKPKPAVSAPAKPLTNGVAKRPASATSTG